MHRFCARSKIRENTGHCFHQFQHYTIARYYSANDAVSDCTSPATKVQATRKWMEQVVIGEKLCPFAAPLLKKPGLIRIVPSSVSNTKETVVLVQQEVEDLVGDCRNKYTANENGNEHAAWHETTLIVMDKHSFVEDYLEFVRLSWTLQEQAVGEAFQEKVQLVLFHPQATHQTYGPYSSSNDNDEFQNDMASPGDYTIRSPYPTIHLLREEDVMKAVTSGYPDLEYLPSRNKAKLMEQGIDVCRKRLQDCYRED